MIPVSVNDPNDVIILPIVINRREDPNVVIRREMLKTIGVGLLSACLTVAIIYFVDPNKLKW